MLELDGGRYAKGDAHYNDMCYYIAASRAAIHAGKRTVKRTCSIKKTSHKKYERATNKRRQREREVLEQSSVRVLSWSEVTG